MSQMMEEECGYYCVPRVGEKEVVQDLNTRLQDYIDKVRSSSEQEDLEPRLDELKRNRDSDIDSIKENYARNLLAARKTLDETAKEKAHYQLRHISLQSQIERVKQSIARLKRENAETVEKVLQTNAEVALSEQEKMDCEVQKDELEKRRQELEETIEAKSNLIDENKLARVDLENKLQTQKEEVQFTRKLIQSEIEHEDELKCQLEAHYAKSEADLQADIQQRMEEAISDLQARTEQGLLRYRDDVETHFSDKKLSLEQDVEIQKERVTSLRSELARLQHLQVSCDKREASIHERMELLTEKLQIQSDEMDADSRKHDDKKREFEATAHDIEQNYIRQIDEMKGLLELRNGLDHEIEAYRRMLNEEERRLSIRLVSRVAEGEQEATCSHLSEERFSLHISFVEPSGKYIEVANRSDSNANMANHRIRNVSGESEQVFKYHQRHRIAAGAAMRVWAHCPEAVHDLPHDFTWKKENAWNLSAGLIELINGDGDVISSFEKDAPQT